jgi:hypothetical protein
VKKPKEDRIREDRIIMEIVVDCYNEQERYMGWYCHLEQKLKFPFQAKCTYPRPTSPLKKGESITVIGMLHDDFDYPSDIKVKIRWQGRTMGVPLSQIVSIDAGDEADEAIADWHYWDERNYRF